MKQRDLSVRQRLAAGSLVVAALIATLGISVGVAVSDVSALRREKVTIIAPRAQAAEGLEKAIYQQAVALRNYALTDSPADLAAFRAAQQEVAARMTTLSALPKSPAGQELFARIGPLVAEHHRAFDAFLEHARSGADRDALREHEASVSAIRNQLVTRIRAFSARQARLSEQADRAIDEAVDHVRRTIVVLTLLILAASLVTAFFVARSVRAPAVRLVAAAEAMRAGSFAPALALEDDPGWRDGKRRFRDELRETAHVFARMAAALQARELHIAKLAAELQVQNEELQAQGEELQVQNEELQAQGEELLTQSDELQTQAEELRAQQETLTRANEELQRAEEQTNRFLAVLGHELRNPLAAIRGAVGVLDHDAADGKGARTNVLEVMKRQTTHLGRLLDDLLDVGRITSGKIPITRRRLELAALVERCVTTIVADASDAPDVRVEAAGPVWVDADETRVEQVVANLLTNALKYTPREGRITVRVGLEGSQAFLQVADTGMGIGPELLPRIFDYFVQGDVHPAGKPGLGLGLALVKNLVELHDGTIHASSGGRGQGATFTVRLPALTETPNLPLGAAAPPQLPIKRSIVLVEDNDDVRRMMQILLKRAGHTVGEAHDGPSGVKAITEMVPDLALVDLDLPVFDGFEVARRLRADSRLAGIHLISLSGHGRSEDRERALAAGFDDHMVKPLEFDRLNAVLLHLRTTDAKGEPA